MLRRSSRRRESAGRKALRMVKAIWPETKRLTVMDQRSVARTGDLRINPQTNLANANVIFEDELPYPLLGNSGVIDRYSGGRLDVGQEAQNLPPWLPAARNLVDRFKDILRPLHAIAEEASYDAAYSTIGTHNHTREGNEISLYGIDCDISIEPQYLPCQSVDEEAWGSYFPAYEAGVRLQDDARYIYGVNTPATAIPDVFPGLHQLLEPAYLDIIWYELPQAKYVHKMMLNGDLAATYDDHIPKLWDIFSEYGRTYYQLDSLDGQILDVVPEDINEVPLVRRSLYATEYKKYIRQSRISRGKLPWEQNGPSFKIHRHLRITQRPPRLRDVAARLNHVASASVVPAPVGLHMNGEAPDSNLHLIVAQNQNDADTVVNADQELQYVGHNIFGRINARDLLKSKRRVYDMSLNFHGQKIKFFDDAIQKPEEAAPVQRHSMFGQCERDLRLAVLSTHGNDFWRMRVQCTMRWFG